MQKGHYYKKQILVCRECKSDEFTVSYAMDGRTNQVKGNACRVCGNFWYFPKSLWYDKPITDSDILERHSR